MPARLMGRQIRALQARATLSSKANSRFEKGVRDAQLSLAKILDAHPNEDGELYNALRQFLAEGPAWDSSDYEDGGSCVHDDVAAVLDADREVIAELLDTLNPEGRS